MLTNKNAISLMSNTTVNLNSSMTATAIQLLIDSMPRNLGGFNLTFQFADGTYTLDTKIYFNRFYNGQLYIYGNSADNTKSVTKAVKLYSSAAGVIVIAFNTAVVIMRYIDLRNDDVANAAALALTQNTIVAIQYLYIHVVGLTAGNVNALTCFECPTIRDYLNLFGLSNLGLYVSQNSHYILQSSSDNGGGDQPVLGTYTDYGAVVAKSDGGAVAGSSTNETSLNGSVIR